MGLVTVDDTMIALIDLPNLLSVSDGEEAAHAAGISAMAS